MHFSPDFFFHIKTTTKTPNLMALIFMLPVIVEDQTGIFSFLMEQGFLIHFKAFLQV